MMRRAGRRNGRGRITALHAELTARRVRAAGPAGVVVVQSRPCRRPLELDGLTLADPPRWSVAMSRVRTLRARRTGRNLSPPLSRRGRDPVAARVHGGAGDTMGGATAR